MGVGVGKGLELREEVLPSGKIEQLQRKCFLRRKQQVHGWEAESGHRQHQGRWQLEGHSTGPEHRYARSLQDLQKVKPSSDSHLKVLHPWDY